MGDEVNNTISLMARGQTVSFDVVGKFLKIMPQRVLPKAEFYAECEPLMPGFETTHSQVVRQIGLIYEDEEGNIHPRFTRKVSMSELSTYMQHCAELYYVPNPYTKISQNIAHLISGPVVLYQYVKGKISQNGSPVNLQETLSQVFPNIVGNNADKVITFLDTFTDIGRDGEIKTWIQPSNEVKDTPVNYRDAKEYFDYLSPQTKNNGINKIYTMGSVTSLNNQILTAIRTKPFILLAGISGTGKSRIVRKLAQATDNIDTFPNEAARWECHSPANFKLIQVKPNWHNSMDVVGYKSNIGGEHYEFTPFVEFVAKAWKHPNTPFFLCLDEMNLAPVEEYFAEYLSAIESRTLENGEYETDPIIKPFAEFGKEMCEKMIDHLVGKVDPSSMKPGSHKADLVARYETKGLTLPPNLIVMGTVNMDDTTFSFSRKVLDRAMSIEMNEVNYDAFLNGDTENDVPVLEENNALLIDRPLKGTDVKDFIEAESVIEYLKEINTALDGTPFKLGYRAANEALLYVAAAKTLGNDDLADALDQFTLMKILSRIEGDESKLMSEDDKTILDVLKEIISEKIGGDNRKSIQKIDEMIKILKRDHFVSYWA